MTKTSTELKICGITQTDQALEIASLGVDALGVIGVKSSPRFLSESKRELLFQELIDSYPNTARVLVVANANDAEIEKAILSKGSPSIIQLHGSESKQRCLDLKQKYPQIKWWKALRIRSESDLDLIKDLEDFVDAILLDAWSDNQLGGTGKRLHIGWLQNIEIKVPWWLAGGISAEWIPEVLSTLNPFGLDASSKLEISPGIKDIRKVELLINAINSTKVR